MRPRDGARPPAIDTPDANVADVSVLDILLDEELRDDFARECENLLLFDRVYDAILANLDSIAREAGTTHSLSRESVQKLIDAALEVAVRDQAVAADGCRRRRDAPATVRLVFAGKCPAARKCFFSCRGGMEADRLPACLRCALRCRHIPL